MSRYGRGATETALDASLLLVSSHHMGWVAVRAMLAEEPGLRIVGETQDGDGAVDLVRRLRPDAVLVDVDWERYDAPDLARRVRDCSPDTKVLAFSSEPDQRIERSLAALGVEGFILWEDVTPDALHYALGAALVAGLCVGSHAAVEELVATPDRRRRPRANEPTFTDREREILRLLADGLTEQEVAIRTGIGLRSAERTATRLEDKLCVTSLHELRRKARELGFG